MSTVKNTAMKHCTINQPEEWIEAWKRQARKEKMTLSEWIGQKCNIALPSSVFVKLPERPGMGRPKAD